MYVYTQYTNWLRPAAMVPGMRRRGRPSSFPSPPPATPAGSAPDRSYVYACRGTRTMPSSSPSLTASFALLCALLAASEAAAADNVFTRAVNRAAPRPLTFYGNALSVYGQCEGDCDSDEDCYAGWCATSATDTPRCRAAPWAVSPIFPTSTTACGRGSDGGTRHWCRGGRLGGSASAPEHGREPCRRGAIARVRGRLVSSPCAWVGGTEESIN